MPIEEQLLPHESLAPWYEKVVWIYVCRTWDEDERDREAARTHDRFGVTSWPHLFLIDPRDDRVLARAGRSRAALENAFETAAEAVPRPSENVLAGVLSLREAKSLVESDPERAATMLRDLAGAPDALEVAFEAGELVRTLAGRDDRTLDERLADPSPHERILAVEALAEEGPEALDPSRRSRLGALLGDPHEDVVVRFRAERCLLEVDPDSVLDSAEALLLTGNDVMRFALLDAIRDRSTPQLTPVLVHLFQGAGTAVPSGNPNVLRMRAARCLVVSGDARAIDALEGVARAADARNVTTRTVVEALGAIAARAGGDVGGRVIPILLDAYPAAVDGDEGEKPSSVERYALRLAETVTAAILSATSADVALPPVPDRWTPQAREAYLERVQEALR